jgi:predicted DNA-binding transcriptional regulator AlpA
MKALLEPEDIQAIATAVVEKLLPLLKGENRQENEDRLLTVKELSAYIGLSPQWIYNNKKTLPHIDRNRKPLFRRSEIDEWLRGYRKDPAESNSRKPKFRQQGKGR